MLSLKQKSNWNLVLLNYKKNNELRNFFFFVISYLVTFLSTILIA
ncbi:conserved domain protein [Phocaeicola vulgatus PC510]|uniref:Conserved domain protein n=1 Tax=Phocaeicola vulgatus PC510 TaxID=702446 RepID=D4V7Y0_PHOVU|nr:conserved domain protein [Phocaeicola vulgatus PC510]